MADPTAPTHRVIVHVTGEQVVLPLGDPIPPGWTSTDVVGTEQECWVHVAIAIRLKEEAEAIEGASVAPSVAPSVAGRLSGAGRWLWDGPNAYVGRIQGEKIVVAQTTTGVRGLTNHYVDPAVPAATDALRSLCVGIAALAVVGMLLNRFLREVRLPAVIVKGLYVLALVTVCASLFALRSRPEPWTYAASLPLQTTLSTERPRSAPPSETVAPGLTVHYDCITGRPAGSARVKVARRIPTSRCLTS